MCRKLSFSVCVVLFCAGMVVAKPIDDPNYNLGFEYHWPDCYGVAHQIYGHTGIGDTPPSCDPCDPNLGVQGWLSTGSGFQGVDVFCPYAYDSPTHCHQWPAGDGVVYVYLQHSGYGITQLLDGNDANAVIVAGRKYTMLFDAMDVGTTGMRGEFYSASADPIVSGSFILPEILQPTENCDAGENELDDDCLDWHYDLKVQFIALVGDPFLGETLGVRFETNGGGGGYAFMDHVRLDWVWATDAFNPSPANGEEDVAKDVNLAWEPGLWATNHIVYFNEDFNKVDTLNEDANQGLQGPNTFDPTPSGGELDLGKTYYWRIVEVNDSFVDPGGGVPSPPWVGDVWSLEVTGYATNPSPGDGDINVPFVGTVLSWSPGTDSNSHDVYFGTDEDDVTNATTSVTLGVFVDNCDVNSYNPGALMLGETYYWRIDEVNETAATLLKGKIWSFRVAEFLAVDEFDSYSNNTELYAVWKDYVVNYTGAVVYIETGDANFIEDGNSMQYDYYDNSSPYYSEAYADITDLGVTANWTVGGLEALRLAFIGDYDNALDDMYVALRDGSGRTGKVLYDGDPNDVKRQWLGFHEWNILLSDFVDDNSVNLSNISRITIGFGDKTAGGTGTMYFDSIRLYPSRCVLAKSLEQGNFNSDPECLVDGFDLDLLAERDWLLTAIGSVTAASPNNASTSLVGWWTMNDDDAALQVDDSSGNAHHGLLYDEDRTPGRSTSKHSIDDGAIGKALTFDGVDDYVEIQPLNLNTNTMTISAWARRSGSPEIYAGIVFSSDPCDPNTTAGIMVGADTETWEANNELAYMWTGTAWEWHTGLFLPDHWAFVALTIAPDVATVYLDDGIGLKAARNYVTHEVRPWAGKVHIGDQMQYADRIWKGAIDDVRIYNYTLTPAEILYLAKQGAGSAYLDLPAWRADADNDDKVNFNDFGAMADNWLTQAFWP
jgi:hypothetical protein